jgi:hypothetical protein
VTVDDLTGKQCQRLTSLFATDAHVEVEATWGIYQRVVAAYREEDRTKGRRRTVNLIESISSGVPKARSPRSSPWDGRVRDAARWLQGPARRDGRTWSGQGKRR